MKRLSLAALLVLVAAPLLAEGRDDCTRALTLSSLYEVRSLMMRHYSSTGDVDSFIDKRIDALRVPMSDGTYKWVHYALPKGDPNVEKKGHNVKAVQGSGTDSVEGTHPHTFAVKIVVPRKRSLLNANNPVYVGTVRIDSATAGSTRPRFERINAWMNPDTSKTFDLDGIADRVYVGLDAAAEAKHVGESLVEIHFLEAVPTDDPANPSYDTIQTLKHIQHHIDAYTVDTEIAHAEQQLLPGSDSLPLLQILADFRRADDLIRSKKDKDKEEGEKLLKNTLEKLRR